MTLRLSLLMALLVAAFLPACLFDTRDASAPDDDEGNVIILDSPEKVFLALETALVEQEDANYERALSETYIFSPTLADSLDQNFVGTDVYLDFDKTVELDVLGLLLSDAQSIAVDFAPQILINENTFVRFRTPYELRVVSAGPDTTTYEGVAQFDVRLEGGNWRITFWDEVETVEGASTWGFLKGILRLRLG